MYYDEHIDKVSISTQGYVELTIKKNEIIASGFGVKILKTHPYIITSNEKPEIPNVKDMKIITITDDIYIEWIATHNHSRVKIESNHNFYNRMRFDCYGNSNIIISKDISINFLIAILNDNSEVECNGLKCNRCDIHTSSNAKLKNLICSDRYDLSMHIFSYISLTCGPNTQSKITRAETSKLEITRTDTMLSS
jgi:hypothetical protein